MMGISLTSRRGNIKASTIVRFFTKNRWSTKKFTWRKGATNSLRRLASSLGARPSRPPAAITMEDAAGTAAGSDYYGRCGWDGRRQRLLWKMGRDGRTQRLLWKMRPGRPRSQGTR